MSSEMFMKLKQVFHEPSRLAIMSQLAATDQGLTFSQLKDACDLTDGNLSRHLKTLEDAGVIIVEKSFIGQKPRTTIFLSDDGRDHFVSYLDALANVLIKASEALERPAESAGGMEPARA